MTHSAVHLLGTGTCRIDPARAPVSACVIQGDTSLLFDCGLGAIERFVKVGGIAHCRDLHVHISHRHTDHLLGLFALLQCVTWSDDARHLAVRSVTIHATNDVCDLITKVRSAWGEEETSVRGVFPKCEDRILSFQAGPNEGDWEYQCGSLEVSSVHLPGAYNHGIAFSLDGVRYAFTGDATDMCEQLVRFCKDRDVCVFDFGHPTNVRRSDGSFAIDIGPIAELLANAQPKLALAAHGYLRHLQDTVMSEDARRDELQRLVQQAAEAATRLGFSGRLLVAQDGMRLDASRVCLS